MHKITHKQKFVAQNQSEKLDGQTSTKGLFDFFRQAATSIGQKSSIAMVKLQEKLSETPSVFVLPMQSRKKSQHQTKTTMQKESGSIRLQQAFLSKQKSKSHLGEKQQQKLRELMRRKQELMGRLKKIDRELHNPYGGVLSSQPSNDSFVQLEYEKGQMLRPIESRITFKQNNAYNVMQHEKTMEMLSRLNNEKMRRQEKMVNELRKKQEMEIRNLQQIQKNKSQLFAERHSRPATKLKSPFKKLSEKQTEFDQDTSHVREISQNTEVEEVKKIELDNEFAVVEDIQIGNENLRVPTEQSAANTIERTD